MAGWYIWNFECVSEDAAREFLTHLVRERNILEPPTDYSGDPDPDEVSDAVSSNPSEREIVAAVIAAASETEPADAVASGRYVYVHSRWDQPDLLDTTREKWERAVIGKFGGATETLVSATLIDNDGKGATYKGKQGYGGARVISTLDHDHDFRFRVYGGTLPTAITFGALPGAFDAVDTDAIDPL